MSEQENQRRIQKGKQELQQVKYEIESSITSTLQEQQKLLDQECQMRNHQQGQKNKKTSQPYDQLKATLAPLKEKIDKLLNSVTNHPKLSGQDKEIYRDPTSKLHKILGKVDPDGFMSVKHGDRFFLMKFNDTIQIVDLCQTHLDRLMNAGCCGAGGIKKAIKAEFPKLKIIVENFWRTLSEVKLNAKEGLEYQAIKFDISDLQQQINNILNKLNVVQVTQTKIELKEQQTRVEYKEKIVEKPVRVEVPGKPDEVKFAYELCYGINRPQHISRGLDILIREATRNNNISAQNCLGKLYYEGRILSQNYKKSYEYYMMAFKQNDPEAIYRIGQFHEQKTIFNAVDDYSELRRMDEYQHMDKAIQYYKQSGAQGHLDSLTDLGFLYEKGFTTKQHENALQNQSEKQAEDYYVKAQEEKSYPFPRALNNLALLYQNQGKKKDAFNLLLKAVSKEEHGRASFNLGICYQKGIGTRVDHSSAKTNFKASYEKGDIYGKLHYAYYILADAAEIDDLKGYRQAYNLFNQVLAEDDQIPEAYYYLAYMYENGYGITQCEVTSFDYYKIACEKRLAKAQNKMGEIYEYGQFNVERDIDEAIRYYKMAKAQNDETAMVNLGRIHENTETEEGYAEAYKLYKEAARVGSYQAQTAIGELYRQGKGVEKDENLAIKYLEIGAQKDGNARYILEQLIQPIVLDQITVQDFGVPMDTNNMMQSPSKSQLYQSQFKSMRK